MFGVLETKGCRWPREAKSQWWSHICGTCVALRDHCGQLARLTTNYDAALVSVLCEAQAAAPLATVSQVCPLRGFRRADVIASDSPAARYAASVSTLMAASRIEDHLADGDHWSRRLPAFFRFLARRWKESARRLAERLGFDTGAIEERVAGQAELERRAGRDYLSYSRPTEESIGEICAHTATLTERPENFEPLRQIGRMFGRIMFLLDAYRDLDEDRANGQFNALAAAYPDAEIRPAARRFFADAQRRIGELFSRLRLREPRLARSLLVDELGAIGARTLGHSPSEVEEDPKKDEGCCFEACCDGCCSCCDSCSCCADCARCGKACHCGEWCEGCSCCDGCCCDGCCGCDC
jgi:hypothetical protein